MSDNNSKSLLSYIPVVGGLIDSIGNWFSGRKNRKHQERMNQLNIQHQKEINQQNIDWARENYEMSRKDAIEFWDMQNKYNLPSAEMDRMREAGLNPHLIYGTGTTASRAGSIDSPEFQTPNLEAPALRNVNHEGLPGVGSILSHQLMAAQVEKTRAEAENIDVHKETKAIDLAVKKNLGLERLERNLQYKMAGENYKNTRMIRETEAWIMSAFGQSGDDSIHTDILGSYELNKGTPLVRDLSEGFRQNELINKAKEAGIANTVQMLENLKKRAILYDDDHALKEIQKNVQDFSSRMRDLGIGPESTQFLAVIVSLLNSIFGNIK